MKRIYLSPPHMGGLEREYVQEAFDTNWLSPVGPNVDAFEAALCETTGAPHAVAVSSGTAALHLSLILAGVGPGDEVFVSDLTFAASVNPIVYLGATPVLLDSEWESWNLDPTLLEEALEERARKNQPMPKALILVHLYGQSADVAPIQAACERHGVTLIEDAAEALGASYRGQMPGTFGELGVYSFNGNKIITTTGGGALVARSEAHAAHAKKLATQARDPAPHYQHTEIGYNYRLSNVSAGIGRGQLAVLEDRVQARRANFARYQEALGGLDGVTFAPEADWGRHTRWLTCLRVDPAGFGATREDVRLHLESKNIEARPLWKPMHQQPVFSECAYVTREDVGAALFEDGLCLPSGSAMSEEEFGRVVDAIREVYQR